MIILISQQWYLGGFLFWGVGGKGGSHGFQGGSEGNQSSLTGFKDGAIKKINGQKSPKCDVTLPWR